MTQVITPVGYFDKDRQFYLEGHGSYANAHKVTADSHNPELGIEHIKFLQPNSTDVRAPLANVKLNMAFGIVIDGSIYVDADGQSLRFSIHQRAGELGPDRKPVRYYDVVTVPAAVNAQVLRHADAVLKPYIKAPVAGNAAPAEMDSEYAAYLAMKKAAASQPAPATSPANPVPTESLPEGFGSVNPLQNVTPEQIAALKEAGIFA